MAAKRTPSMRLTGLLLMLAAALVSATAVGVGASASAEPAASRVIDRTVACPVGLRAGVRKIQVQARTGARLDSATWKYRSHAAVLDPTAQHAGVGLARITAGWPEASDPATRVVESFIINARECRAYKGTPPALSPAGLNGGAASQFQDDYDCVVPRRILIRVQGKFRAPTTLRVDPGSFNLSANAILKEARLAVRTVPGPGLSGKPIAYATASESGKAQLFVGASCVPD